jgi:LPS O-antigen subunit length determinant protein (WzzB/FepE family)
MLPGSIVVQILDEISPAITKNLNFIEAGIFKSKIKDFKDNMYILTASEEEEIRSMLVKIKALLDKELK